MILDELLIEIERASSASAKRRVIREFANAHPSPIVEETCATFFYVSPSAHEIALEGDWTNWKPTAPLTRVDNTPLWYRAESFPREARLEYRFIVNGRRRLDPRNPRLAQGGLGPNSEIAMPGYVPPRALTDESRITRGVVEQHWINSNILEDRRAFWVCLPPNYDLQQRYPVAYLNDGGDYLRFADVPRIADYLIDRGSVAPFIAVLVKPNERMKDYAYSDAYADFVANELVPWIDARYPTFPESTSRAAIGASLGGLAAAHAALRRPNVFGLVGGQSGVYSYQDDVLIKDYAAAQNLGVRFHLIVGLYETDLHGEGRLESNLLEAQRRFAEMLRAKGYEVITAEYPEGHSWGLWRAHIGDALKSFWGV